MERVTGALRIVGNAGGLFHLRDGAVIAVDSPGSPGVETLLLGSVGISAEDWAAALTASVETRSLQAALVARGVIGPARAQAVALAAVRDAAFAVAAGRIERYAVVDDPVDVPLLPVTGGVEPDLLLADTVRRLNAVALSPYENRVVLRPAVKPVGLTAERREIVAHATGRRTVRDIAFAVGRGLHPVAVEVSRMLGEGVLEIASPDVSFGFAHGELVSLRPRAGPGPAGGPGADQGGSLPARRPGRVAPDSRNRPRSPFRSRKEESWTTTPWSPSCGSSGRTSPE